MSERLFSKKRRHSASIPRLFAKKRAVHSRQSFVRRVFRDALIDLNRIYMIKCKKTVGERMRMRKKPWVEGELRACEYYLQNPREHRCEWNKIFKREQPLHIELGCGKGVSTAKMAAENPQVNYIGIDLIDKVLGHARRNIAHEFEVLGRNVDNIVIFSHDIMHIFQVMDKTDVVERIYINFCNPWTRKLKSRKKRLTHPRQLMQYRDFLTEDGEIWFKTDCNVLFEDSLEYFAECGFEIAYITRDLHSTGFSPNYESEHEIRFAREGLPINFLIAKKQILSHNPEYDIKVTSGEE